jgi:tRNA modification GTPase
LQALAGLEARLDFPDEELGEADLLKTSSLLEKAAARLKELLQGARAGRALREGLRVVICGSPNAGKSSLLNTLLKEERSIVTAVAGTTRDSIEELVDIRGIPVRLVDTAGILRPRGPVERKALLRARQQIKGADLLLVVFDSSRKLDRRDMQIIAMAKGSPCIALLNKSDLKPRIEEERVAANFRTVLRVSAKKAVNIGLLEEAIAGFVYAGRLNPAEPAMVSSRRHASALKQAENFVALALDSLDNKAALDCVCEDIRQALGCVDGLLGKDRSGELLQRIFSDFCVGK